MHEETTSEYNRRTVLQTTGAISGVGVFGMGKVDGKSRNSLGERLFAEVDLSFDVDIDERSEWSFPIVHIDEIIGHELSKDQETLLLTNPERSGLENTFKDSVAVIKGQQYQPLPASEGNRPTTRIVTRRGHRGRAVEGLLTESPVRLPNVSVAASGIDIDVVVSGIKRTVEPKDQGRIELPNTPIQVQVERPLDRKVDAPEVPQHRRVNKRETKTVSLQAKPVVKIRNYGTVEVQKET